MYNTISPRQKGTLVSVLDNIFVTKDFPADCGHSSFSREDAIRGKVILFISAFSGILCTSIL